MNKKYNTIIIRIVLTPLNFLFAILYSILRTIIWFFYIPEDSSFFGIDGPSINPFAIAFKGLFTYLSLGIFLLVPFGNFFLRIFSILQKIITLKQLTSFLSYVVEILFEGFPEYKNYDYEDVIINKQLNRCKIYSTSKKRMRLGKLDLAINGFEKILTAQNNVDYKNTKKFLKLCISENKYQIALKHFDNKEFSEAYELFSHQFLYNYKDSQNYIEKLSSEYTKTSDTLGKYFEEGKFDLFLNEYKKNKSFIGVHNTHNSYTKKYDFTKMEKTILEVINNYRLGNDYLSNKNFKEASETFGKCNIEVFANGRKINVSYRDSLALQKMCDESKNLETKKNKKLESGKYYFEKGDYEIAYGHFSEIADYKDAYKYLEELEHILKISKEVNSAINLDQYELAEKLMDDINQKNILYFEDRKKLVKTKILEIKINLHEKLYKLIVKYSNDYKLIEISKKAIINENYPEALLNLSQVEYFRFALPVYNQAIEKLTHQLNANYLHQNYDFITSIEKRLVFKVSSNNKVFRLSNYQLIQITDPTITRNIKVKSTPAKFNGIDAYVYEESLYISKETSSFRKFNSSFFYKIDLQIKSESIQEIFTLTRYKIRLYLESVTAFIEEDFDSFIILSETIINYKDVSILRIEAHNKIKEYNSMIINLNSKNFEEVVKSLNNLGQFRDSNELRVAIEKMVNYYESIKNFYNNDDYMKVFEILTHTDLLTTSYNLNILEYKDTKDFLRNAENRLISELTYLYNLKNFDEVISILKKVRYFETNEEMNNDYNNDQDFEKDNKFDLRSIRFYRTDGQLKVHIPIKLKGPNSKTNLTQSEELSLSNKLENLKIEEKMKKNHPLIHELFMKTQASLNEYNNAKKLISSGLYEKAFESLKSIIDYKDSKTLSLFCFTMFKFNDYLKFFFNEFCGIFQENLSFVALDERYKLAIVKDKVERLTGRNSSGKLMERTWRNVVFYTIKQNDLNDTSSSSYSNLAQNIFNDLKLNQSYLFVRSYVYIILVNQNDPSNISKSDYHLFYFNTNYRFGPVNGKHQIFNNVDYSFVVQDLVSELKSMRDKNMDSIDCAKAYSGQLPLYEATKEKINSLFEKIDKKEISRLLIEGPARSGKTIIAMQLLHQFPQANFLLMNYYFYLALKDAFAVIGISFPSTRIFHHDLSKQRESGCAIERGNRGNGWKKSFKLSLDFVIVDEAQRLSNLDSQVGYTGIIFPGFAELDILVRESKISIFLGDNYQRINPKYDEGFEKIRSILNESKINFINYRFNETIGIPVNLVNSFKYILDYQSKNIDSFGNHQVRLFNQISDFVDDFKSNPTYSKHYVSLPEYSLPASLSPQGITIYPVELRYSDYPFFLNSETLNRYVHSTYEVISRELQSLYLVIPDSITYNENKGIFDSANKLSQEYLFNHLYVNMTRATQKLVIFTANQSLFEYLKNRIAKVTDHQFKDEWKNYSVEEQKLNFVTNFSDKSSSSSLKAVLLKNGFTGFVHATEINNVEKILNSGYLYSRDSANDTFKDIADQNVIYRTSSFVKSNVRFYYASGTPTLYHFSNKSSHLVILEFIYELVENYECYFTDGNAASNYTTITGNLKEAINFNWQMIFSRGPFNEIERREIIRRRNAELLVNADVCIKPYLKSIIFKEQIDLEKIANNFPEFKLLCKIDKSRF